MAQGGSDFSQRRAEFNALSRLNQLVNPCRIAPQVEAQDMAISRFTPLVGVRHHQLRCQFMVGVCRQARVDDFIHRGVALEQLGDSLSVIESSRDA